MANSQQFYKRLNQLAGTDKKIHESTDINNSTLIDVERANDGTALGIVKENHEYHVKVSKVKGDNLSSPDFTYIGGFRNKTENQFKSLSEAQKQRNYKLRSLNEAFSLSGKSHLLKEGEIKNEKTSLVVEDDINSFLRNRILEGKKNINAGREDKFKFSLKKEKEEIISNKKGLMNENALHTIQKALGIINEDDLSTKDSLITNNDSVAQKANNPNTKTGKSISTEDSDIQEKDEVANKKGKEESQAPINDKNAKSEAEKAKGKDSVPSKPKTEKTVSVDNVSEGKDISTEDSEANPKDSVAQSEKITTKPEASYNNYNQPDKGQKEEKGEKLKPIKSKGTIVAENEVVSTADSEANPNDSVANKTNAAPNTSGESIILADSEIDAKNSVANKTNNPSKNSGDVLSTVDSEADADDSIANKTNIKEGIEDTLAAAEEKENELDVVDTNTDTEDTADIDIDNMDLNVEEPIDNGDEASDVDSDEESVDDVDGSGDLDVEEPIDPSIDDTGAGEDSESIDNDGGGEEDPMIKEIEKLAGKLGHAVQNANLDVTKTDEIFTALIGNFEKNLAKAGSDKGNEWSDKIEKATAGEGANAEVKFDDKSVSDVPSEDDDTNTVIDQQINDLNGEGVEEDTPMTVDGDEVIDDDLAAELDINDPETESCSECGTFEEYVTGRGMNIDECSGMEIADLVSGYADAHKEGMNDGDFEGVAVYLANPQVKTDVTDYGYGDYVTKAEPFIKNVGENAVNFGSYEPMVDIEEDYDDDANDLSDNSTTNPMPFANAEVMGAGIVKPESATQKSVDVDLNSGKVIVTVNEQEKLRKLIRINIEEALGKRKPSLNENQKSETSKKIDKIIVEQLNLYGALVGKKIGK